MNEDADMDGMCPPDSRPVAPASAGRAEYERQAGQWKNATPWDELHPDTRRYWEEWAAKRAANQPPAPLCTTCFGESTEMRQDSFGMKKPTPIERLMNAMDACAVARGEAQWTHGYRTGRPDKEAELYAKQMAQWTTVEKAEARFRRVALAVLREARKPKRRANMKEGGLK